MLVDFIKDNSPFASTHTAMCFQCGKTRHKDELDGGGMLVNKVIRFHRKDESGRYSMPSKDVFLYRYFCKDNTCYENHIRDRLLAHGAAYIDREYTDEEFRY